MSSMNTTGTEKDTSEVALERRRRELAEEQLEKTQRELAEYKARVKSLSANPDKTDSLSALTGSFRVASLAGGPSNPKESVSELSRKASTLFAQNPSAKELKKLLRELIISGDETAKRLAAETSASNSSELVSYLKTKSQIRLHSGMGNYIRKRQVSENEKARAKELAELRAEGGVSMGNNIFSGFSGFHSAPATPNATPDSQKKAQQRFASKRERPQSYGHYIKPPSLNKTKLVQPQQLLHPRIEPSPVFQGLQPVVETNPTSGLLNLSELNGSNVMDMPPLGPNPLLGIQPPPTHNNFNLLNQMNPMFSNQYTFQSQCAGFTGFGVPFAQLNGYGLPGMIPPPPRMEINQHSVLLKSDEQSIKTLPPNVSKPVTPTAIKKIVPKIEPENTNNIRKQPPRRWTEEEDQLLRNSVKKYGARNWKNIATEVPGRNHVQCLQRWRKALDPKVVKGHWSPEEDTKLLKLVEMNPKNWGHVARGIEGRTAKQCRERFHNHLDPSIKKGNWSFEEDKLIVLLQKDLGNKWAEIAKKLEGRTENSVKIRWKSIKRQVIALREESQIDEKDFLKRKIKRNTMDKERLDKLLVLWDFSG